MRKLTRTWQPVELSDITEAIFQLRDTYSTGPTSSFDRLNKLVGGVLRDGIVFTADPGHGKTILASHLAVSSGIGGHEVIYVDAENDRADIMERLFLIFASMMMGSDAPTKGQLLKDPRILAKPEIVSYWEDHISKRLWVVDSSYENKVTPAHLAELVEDRVIVLKDYEKTVVLVIDSINEINSLYPLGKSEYESLQKWLAQIKHIKAKYQIPVILICHRRIAETKEKTMLPKGTSGLGHFARTQIHVEREGATLIAKVTRSQYGQRGKVELHFDRTRLWLQEKISDAGRGE